MRVRDLKGGAMFLFARMKGVPFAQGKTREPGLQENSVRNFTGRQGPRHVLTRATFYKVALLFFPFSHHKTCFAKLRNCGPMRLLCCQHFVSIIKNPGRAAGDKKSMSSNVIINCANGCISIKR